MQTGTNNSLELYPSVTADHLNAIAPALCPFEVKLPRALHTEIQKLVPEFLNYKKETSTAPWQDSVLNSLDFHYSSEKLKIIEANTNASGYLLSNLLLNDENSILKNENVLFKSFQKVFQCSDFKKIFIIDTAPEQEKMYTEFLMYKDFFKRHHVDAEVLDTSKLLDSIDKSLNGVTFVYNRDTDFHLDNHQDIKQLWQAQKIALSTTPYSYQNIADKKYDTSNDKSHQNLLAEKRFNQLSSAFLNSRRVTPENKDEIWENRKKLFFKPSSSFGSKGVYAGKSVSRKKFEGFSSDYLAQELHPPGKVTHQEVEWKFDIRAFFSEGGLQKTIARVYQGQLTNFSNPGGGFALIDWVD